MDYTQQMIDYILTCESEDFWHWVECDTADILSDEERELLLKQGSADYTDDCIYELDVSIMRRLANYHIFAVAYLLEKGLKS